MPMRGADYAVAATIWSGVFWLLVVIALGAFVYLTARLVIDRRRTDAAAEVQPEHAQAAVAVSSARGILAERLARGEIDIDEYRRRLEAMEP